MQKYILAIFIFVLTACTLGQKKPAQTNLPANASASTSAATMPARISTNAPASSTPTMTPPAPNPAYPLLTARIQAIQVSDDDGGRTARITTQQVKQWIDKANQIFANASVRLVYDPGSDFATLKSTLLNNMIGDTDANWTREVDFGNQVAARYSGKLVVFFRYGPGQKPTGEGFSWSDYNFVAMPGFNDTTVCGYQNIGILAHEVGHYFGLSHPFATMFNSVKEAEAYLSAHGNDPQAFDGDGLSDTPPDPFMNMPEFQCNPSVQSVTLNGQVFTLPRKNIMSYYANQPGVDRTELTPQQSNIVRWMLGLRAKNGMTTPTDNHVSGEIEFKTLAIKSKNGTNPSVQDMSAWSQFLWSGNQQLFCGAQINGLIEFPFSITTGGQYGFDLYATMAPDYGKIQTLVDGNPFGAPVDLYGLLVLPTGKISIGTISLSAGLHTLGFRVVGKNSVSSGYSFGLSAFRLTSGD